MQLVLCASFSNDKTKSLFTPWKRGSIKKSQYWFTPSVDTFAWYLFWLIVLLKRDFNCSSSFALSWADKVTTGTQSFVSVIQNLWLQCYVSSHCKYSLQTNLDRE